MVSSCTTNFTKQITVNTHSDLRRHIIFRELIRVSDSSTKCIGADSPRHTGRSRSRQIILILRLHLRVFLLRPLTIERSVRTFFLRITGLILALASGRDRVRLARPRRPINGDHTFYLAHEIRHFLVRHGRPDSHHLSTVVRQGHDYLISNGRRYLTTVTTRNRIRHSVVNRLIRPIKINGRHVLPTRFTLRLLLLLLT